MSKGNCTLRMFNTKGLDVLFGPIRVKDARRVFEPNWLMLSPKILKKIVINLSLTLVVTGKQT